mmetsp:Transcript_29117/g.78072  ORF Transcript_29117/g.78072 Transcript_29117/m.78072 type:complete len:242 (+) Transcript_29117:549-1274(+)
MAASSDAKVLRTLYRAMLRWTKSPAAASSKFTIPNLENPTLDNLTSRVAIANGSSQVAAEVRPRNADGVRAVIRNTFRASVDLVKEEGEESQDHLDPVDLAFEALRTLHDFTQTLESQEKRREESLNRDGVEFSIGDVLLHKKFGYRGVVCGWDRRPVTDVSSWNGVQGLPSGSEQPFYHIIPDTNDITEAEPRSRSDFRYCAQENLSLLPPVECRVTNDAVTRIFDEFIPSEGPYLLINP